MSQVEAAHSTASDGSRHFDLLVGTNWKMTLTPAQTRSYVETLRALTDDLDSCQLFVLPPFPALSVAASVLDGSNVAWGAQDVHPMDRGAHTGDVSAPMLADLGCTYVAVGHFERRRDYGETDELVAAKARAAQRWGISAVLCVGEVEEVPYAEALDFVSRQLDVISTLLPELLVVAYEPGWAIGEAGKPADTEWLGEMQRGIRQVLDSLFPDVRVPIIVGGSVDARATAPLLTDARYDGVFVGRRALDPQSFSEIAHLARQAMEQIPK